MSQDIFPSSSEILSVKNLACHCGRSFANTSALRLHRVKAHGQIENDSDRRLYSKDCEDGQDVTTFYHCPNERCKMKSTKFKGFRYLRQHYTRAHTQKSLVCECGMSFALEKDRKYHKKNRCSLRSDLETSLVKPKPVVKKSKKTIGVSTSEEITPQIVMIVATANAQETMNIITNALKTTSTIGIQVCPAEVVDSTSTVTVEEGPIQTPEFCDFAGQYNAPMCAYYYPQGNNGVRHISTGTDFVPDYMNYQADMEQYATYDYGQQTDISIPMDNYSNALPMTRSFGTTMDDFMARSRESDFDMLRDIETQTIGEPFWKS